MLKFTLLMLRTISIVSIFYFILIIYYSGLKTSFLWFWLLCSICSGLLSYLFPYAYQSDITWLATGAKIFTAVLWGGILLLLIVEIRLITFSRQTPPENADYVIVLGAQVRGTIPSKTLNMRINTAYQYLSDNPGTKVICSGGKGEGEDISEALTISNRLIELGINKNRIIIEDKSTNTVENLRFSAEYLNKHTDTIVLVSSDFHLFRACSIAKKQGYIKLSGLSAKELLLTTPGYFIREFIAVFKDFLLGNM